ncbi:MULTISPECIES: hypothetical protein [unclassified Streptomyces]|uniref:hypothetical protein n=1 Tax=unclassified Streptomyces TaxID=2593676 RepID=UPI000F451DB7|nr:hypothetical protein [Streptomyces sp. I6]RNL73722.1 hypothetical protein EBF04_28245 [Streptomyces sp. I6]
MRYEFRVSGHLSPAVAGAFPELDEVTVPEETVLYGPVTDEAHLYGLLVRFQDLGLRVVELRRLPD